MIAGSSGLLAVDTFGYSSGEVDRRVDVGVASDADAYLGLVESDDADDGVETGGVLFEETGDDRYPPASFDVINQLTEPVSVSLSIGDDRFRFVELEDGEIVTAHGTRFPESTLETGTGTTVAIDLTLSDDRLTEVGSLMTALTIEATGETTAVEAERTLTVVSGVWAVMDCRWMRSIDGLLVVRERRVDDGRSVVVEWLDRSDGTTITLYEGPSTVTPTLRLSFSDETTPRRNGVATRRGKPSPNPPIERAAGVGVELDLERERKTPSPQLGTHSATSADGGNGTNESSAAADGGLVVEIDPPSRAEGTGTGSRPTETIDVSPESVSGRGKR